MDITAPATNLHTSALYAPEPAIPAGQAAGNRDVVEAVKALNGAEMFGNGNELMMQRDPRTQRIVLRIVNQKTKDVVAEVPADYVVRLADDLKQPDYVVQLSQELKKGTG
jgi:uncharacterized FlaG/YvyC family protein